MNEEQGRHRKRSRLPEDEELLVSLAISKSEALQAKLERDKKAKRRKSSGYDDDGPGGKEKENSEQGTAGLEWTPPTRPKTFNPSRYGAHLRVGFQKLYNQPLFSDLTL